MTPVQKAPSSYFLSNIHPRTVSAASKSPMAARDKTSSAVSATVAQGWSDTQKRWFPEVDPDGDGNLTDTPFYLNDPNKVPGVLYPYPPNGLVSINNIDYASELIDKMHFNEIPGLGRALKFTFTLFDSRDIIEDGRTFTHIVYLDE